MTTRTLSKKPEKRKRTDSAIFAEIGLPARKTPRAAKLTAAKKRQDKPAAVTPPVHCFRPRGCALPANARLVPDNRSHHKFDENDFHAKRNLWTKRRSRLLLVDDLLKEEGGELEQFLGLSARVYRRPQEPLFGMYNDEPLLATELARMPRDPRDERLALLMKRIGGFAKLCLYSDGYNADTATPRWAHDIVLRPDQEIPVGWKQKCSMRVFVSFGQTRILRLWRSRTLYDDVQLEHNRAVVLWTDWDEQHAQHQILPLDEPEAGKTLLFVINCQPDKFVPGTADFERYERQDFFFAF